MVFVAINTQIPLPLVRVHQLTLVTDLDLKRKRNLRLKGKRIKELNGHGTGYQLVHVNVWTPKALNSEEKGILEKLRTVTNFQLKPAHTFNGLFEEIKEFFNIN